MRNKGSKGVLIIAPIIIDANSFGGEGQKLYEALKNEGYTTYKKSGHRNKLLRLVDTLWFLIFNNRKYKTVIVMIFGGQSFIMESLAIIAAKVLNKKIIGVIHGGAFHEFYANNKTWCKFILGLSGQVYTPAKFLKQHFEKEGFNFGYLPNFVHLDEFPLKKEKQTHTAKLLWVRSLHKVYQPELAIKAVGVLKNRFPEISLTIIGADKGELENCRKIVKQLHLETRINLLGFVPNNQLIKYYHNHDIFINTTLYESFGVSLMEAASAGMPIISTSVGEIPFLWENGNNIVLIDENNENALAEKIEKLLTDNNYKNMIADNGNKLAKKHEWLEIKKNWFRILGEA